MVTPAPETRHQFISARLPEELSLHARKAGIGFVIAAPVGIILGEHRQVQPDLVLIRKGRATAVSKAASTLA